MALKDDLINETNKIVRERWARRDGAVVPETEDVGLGNEGVDLEATFLYADLADSTELAYYNQAIAAEVVKAYLMGTTRIIRSLGGEIRSFDGDRVMGIFFDGANNTAAAKAGLQINYFFTQILKPAFARVYTDTFPSKFNLTQTVGIDTSKVLAVRTGIRNNNDLVWIGRAPNIAAKLSGIREGFATFITSTVFNTMLDEAKYGGDPRQLMWESRTWKAGEAFGVSTVYRSGWRWEP
jgi:class 3 adenylate cyclase